MQKTPKFDYLLKGSYIRVTTFRKSSAPVPTPVWFAELDGGLVIETEAHSGKVKRICNNPQVTLAPCTATGKPKGASVEATASILTDPAQIERAKAALAKKYNLLRALIYGFMGLVSTLRRKPKEEVAYVRLD